MDWHIVYAKFDGCKGFKAFDINEGRQVGNLIYASGEHDRHPTETPEAGRTWNKGLHLCCNFAGKAECAFRQSKR